MYRSSFACYKSCLKLNLVEKSFQKLYKFFEKIFLKILVLLTLIILPVEGYGIYTPAIIEMLLLDAIRGHYEILRGTIL